MAPYFVQTREFERRLLLGAIEAGGDLASAAGLLGVTEHYARARAKFLGGVIRNEPKQEPPGRAEDAWKATLRSASDRRKVRTRAIQEGARQLVAQDGAHQLDHPDGPRCACGAPSAHESGACMQCVNADA